METERKRNIELMWLVKKISPDHGTLSAFMKNNKVAIKKVFKDFILFIKGLGLIDGNLLGFDDAKLKANSAKNKHYNENIIKKKDLKTGHIVDNIPMMWPVLVFNLNSNNIFHQVYPNETYFIRKLYIRSILNNLFYILPL